MPETAQVRSVEAIASFRAQLLAYLARARATVEEVSSEVQRTKSWLQTEQRLRWEAELARRTRRLETARQELFSAGLSNQHGAKGWHQMQVHRAEEAVKDAAAHLERVRKWGRQFEDLADPLVRQVDKLHTFFTTDTARASHGLARTLRILDEYAAGNRLPAHPSTVPATGPEPAGASAPGSMPAPPRPAPPEPAESGESVGTTPA